MATMWVCLCVVALMTDGLQSSPAKDKRIEELELLAKLLAEVEKKTETVERSHSDPISDLKKVAGSSRKRDCNNSDWMPFSSVGIALVGYDYRRGDPYAQTDPGFKSTIFQLRRIGSDGCEMNRAAFGITILPEVFCSTSIDSTMYKSYESLKEATEEESDESGGVQVGLEVDIAVEASVSDPSGSVSAGGSASTTIPPPFKSGWTESESMKGFQNFFESSGGSIVIAGAHCNTQRVRLSMAIAPPFTQHFKEYLQLLNEANTASADRQKRLFRTFVEDFGTHYFNHMVFGAEVSQVTEFSEEATSSESEETLKKCSSDSMTVSLGISVSSDSSQCSGSSTNAANGGSSSYYRQQIVTKGARPPTSGLREWAQQDFVPMPLHFQLAPIANLLSSHILRRQTGLDFITDEGRALRAWFIPLYWNFCTTMGVDCTETCHIAHCAECSGDLKTCARCSPGAVGDGTDRCTRAVCTASTISGAKLSPEKVTYGVGEDVFVECEALYDYSGDASRKLTCGSDGQWAGTAACNRRCFESNTDFEGNDIAPSCGITKQSALECQAACQATSGCTHFTYITSDYTLNTAWIGKCCLKNAPGARGRVTGLISGPSTCLENGFECDNKQIIDFSKVCDGNNDCTDCSDETGTKATDSWGNACARTCDTDYYNPSTIQCKNGRHVPLDQKCNGYNECDDCTDERIGGCRLRCLEGYSSYYKGNTGDPGYCDNGNCEWGEGDCDYDSDCATDDCGSNNCQWMTGTKRGQFAWDDDCCE